MRRSSSSLIVALFVASLVLLDEALPVEAGSNWRGHDLVKGRRRLKSKNGLRAKQISTHEKSKHKLIKSGTSDNKSEKGLSKKTSSASVSNSGKSLDDKDKLVAKGDQNGENSIEDEVSVDDSNDTETTTPHKGDKGKGTNDLASEDEINSADGDDIETDKENKGKNKEKGKDEDMPESVAEDETSEIAKNDGKNDKNDKDPSKNDTHNKGEDDEPLEEPPEEYSYDNGMDEEAEESGKFNKGGGKDASFDSEDTNKNNTEENDEEDSFEEPPEESRDDVSSSPSQTPEPTLPETAAPVADVPVGTLNDACTSALVVSPGDTILSSTVGTRISNVESCGEAIGGDSASGGLWYLTIGTGSGLNAFVNSTFDVQLSVFAGPDCEILECVSGTSGDSFPWTAGGISWAAEDGDIYYILINGWTDQYGDFELKISQGDIPTNSICESAIPLESGDKVQGSTKFSRIANIDPCFSGGVPTDITGLTVWYSIVGMGGFMQFSLFSDFVSAMSLFTGENCDVLSCVASSDISPIDGPRNLLSMPLEDGQIYYIIVHGLLSRDGEYTMVVETVDAAANDDCTSAAELTLGVYASGSTLSATSDEDIPFCGFGSNESSIGVWYSVQGTGGTLEAFLNGTSSATFSVFSGDDCQVLTCIASQDLPQYPIEWDSIEGGQYLVYVYSSYLALKDSFQVLAREVTRPENNECANAIVLEINGPAKAGTTKSSSTETDLDFCGEEAGFGGVWYTFTGTGGVLLVGVSTDPEVFPFLDSQIAIYSGPSCSELTCVAGNDQGSGLGYSTGLSFQSVEGAAYFVLVHGWGISRGDFTIEVSEVNRPENVRCSDAISLELGDTLAGATFFALQTDEVDFEMCGTSQGGNNSAPGVWYIINGSGTSVDATINGTFDVQLTVFSGDGCSDLTCVDGTEGNIANFFSGSLVWDTNSDTTYYMLVHGFRGQVGEFELFIEEASSPANDEG